MPLITDKLGSEISDSEYHHFTELLEKHCGILLGENKQYLVSNRLSGIIKEQGFSGLGELNRRIQANTQLRQQVIDAMTTNETFWFRDNFPFDILKKRILPELLSSSGELRLWSAACSTGQETYSIVITVDEFNRQQAGRQINLRITATDISERVLTAARSGCYDALSLGRGLSEERKQRYFIETEKSGATVIEPIRNQVQFKYFNLLESSFNLGIFDVIFCRNVLIYFSAERKKAVLKKLAESIRSGGYLFLGASEAIAPAISKQFEMIACHPGIVYRRR